MVYVSGQNKHNFEHSCTIEYSFQLNIVPDEYIWR